MDVRWNLKPLSEHIRETCRQFFPGVLGRSRLAGSIKKCVESDESTPPHLSPFLAQLCENLVEDVVLLGVGGKDLVLQET